MDPWYFFANVRIKNQLAEKEGGLYRSISQVEKRMTVFDAAQKYREENTQLVVLGGREYGSGSSRDWAAKGNFFIGNKSSDSGKL